MERTQKVKETNPLNDLIRQIEENDLNDLIKRSEENDLNDLINQSEPDILGDLIKKEERTSNDLTDIIQKTTEDPLKELLKEVQIETLVEEKKSDIELIATQLLTTQPTDKKIDGIINAVKERTYDTTGKKEERSVLLSKALTSIWVNMRPVLNMLIAATILAIAIALFNVYFLAGSWLSFLIILKNLGVRIVPGILMKAIQKTGISLGTNVTVTSLINLAERNAKIRTVLNTKIAPDYIVKTLNKIGFATTDSDLSVKNITRIAISNGVSLATGDISGFFLSVGINNLPSMAGKVVGGAKVGMEKTVNILNSVKDKVAEQILSVGHQPEPIVTSINLTQKLQPAIETRIKKEVKVDIKKVKGLVPANETTTDIKTMLTENKALAFGTTTCLALVSLACATNVSGVTSILSQNISSLGSAIDLPDLAIKASDFIRENLVARQTLFTILSQGSGLQKLVDILVDKLTPDQRREVETLSRLKNKTPTHFERLFSILLGEKIYDVRELDNSTTTQLKAIAKAKNIKFGVSATKKALLDAIIKDQNYRLSNINKMVTSAIASSAKVALSGAILETAYQNIPVATVKEVEEKLKEPEVQIQQDLDKEIKDIKEAPKTQGDIDKEWEAQMKQAQDALIEEKKRLRELRRPGNERLRAEAVQRKEAESQSRETLANLNKIKAADRLARKRLREAVELNELSRKINVVITTAEGVSHPIPVDDLLLDPRLQNVMKDINFTPLTQYLTLQAAKSTTSWIPGLGYVEASLNTVNWSLDIAEKLKDVYKVVNVAFQITSDTGTSNIDIGGETISRLDWLLKQRVPTLNAAIEDLVKLESVNLKKITLEALKDKLIYGWDNSKVAYEIGKKALIGSEGASLSKLSEDMISQIGDMIAKNMKI